MKDGNACLNCKGECYFKWPDGSMSKCEHCNGTGKAPESPEARVSILELPEEQQVELYTRAAEASNEMQREVLERAQQAEATKVPAWVDEGDDYCATCDTAFKDPEEYRKHQRRHPRPQQNMSDAVDQDVSAVSGEALESPETSKQPADADVSAQQNAGELEMTNPDQEGETMKQRGTIKMIGTATHHSDREGKDWSLENWWMEGGDYPAVDITNGELCGWPPEELRMIAEAHVATCKAKGHFGPKTGVRS